MNISTKKSIVILAVVGGIVTSIILFTQLNNVKTNNQNTNQSIASVSKENLTTYTDYSPDKVSSAKTSHIALFFHASWCPTCIEMDKDLQSNLDSIKNLTILKVNYDKENGLKEKYSVKLQSTWILVDTSGNKIAEGTNFTKATQVQSLYQKYLDYKPTSTSLSTSTMEKSIASQVSTEKKSGINTSYSPELITQSSSEKIVLFFDASWCPTCIQANKNINANLDKIPSNLSILHVDYDKNPDLKKQYGVVIQHTFVQVNAKGEKIKSTTGLNTIEQIIEFTN